MKKPFPGTNKTCERLQKTGEEEIKENVQKCSITVGRTTLSLKAIIKKINPNREQKCHTKIHMAMIDKPELMELEKKIATDMTNAISSPHIKNNKK